MTGRRLATLDIRELILHIRSNPSNRAIAADTSFDRRTIKRYRRWAAEQGLLTGPLPEIEQFQQLLDQTLPAKQPPQNVSSLEPFRPLVEELFQAGVDGTVILDRVRERQYQGSLSSVYRFLKHLSSPEPGAKAVVRVEREVAEEAQVDFGYAGYLIDPTTGVPRKAWVFVMTLSFSRHQYIEFVFDQTIPTWLALHRRAFEFFGGVPRRIVTDNLKSAVTKAYWDGTDPQLQASYRECAEHYAFLIAPCRPRTPQHKGKVEAGVKFVKSNFLAGRSPSSLVEINREAREWCLTRAGLRKHGTTHQQPLVVFEQVEKSQLQPLPLAPYELTLWKEVKVHRDCYIVFENAFYSVPFRLVGQRLRVRATPTTLKFYTTTYELVATHTRSERPGERITNPDHLPPYKLEGLLQNREGVVAEALSIGPFTHSTVENMLADKALERLPSAARLVQLARKFGPLRLEAACMRAQHYGEASYRTVKAILMKGLDGPGLEGGAGVGVGQTQGESQAQTVTTKFDGNENSNSNSTAAQSDNPHPQQPQKSEAGGKPKPLYARSAQELLGHLFEASGIGTGTGVVLLGAVVSGVVGLTLNIFSTTTNTSNSGSWKRGKGWGRGSDKAGAAWK